MKVDAIITPLLFHLLASGSILNSFAVSAAPIPILSAPPVEFDRGARASQQSLFIKVPTYVRRASTVDDLEDQSGIELLKPTKNTGPGSDDGSGGQFDPQLPEPPHHSLVEPTKYLSRKVVYGSPPQLPQPPDHGSALHSRSYGHLSEQKDSDMPLEDGDLHLLRRNIPRSKNDGSQAIDPPPEPPIHDRPAGRRPSSFNTDGSGKTNEIDLQHTALSAKVVGRSPTPYDLDPDGLFSRIKVKHPFNFKKTGPGKVPQRSEPHRDTHYGTGRDY